MKAGGIKEEVEGHMQVDNTDMCLTTGLHGRCLHTVCKGVGMNVKGTGLCPCMDHGFFTAPTLHNFCV